MDKINIKDFEKGYLVAYKWKCNLCDTENHEFESNPKDLEVVFCIQCGNTFEIVK
jgi:hypothetical protein